MDVRGRHVLQCERRGWLFLAAAIILIGLAWIAWSVTAPRELEAESTASRITPSFIEPAELERLITAYEGRVAESTNASDYRTLGFLYLEKARVTGDVTRLAAAEEALTTANRLYPTDPGALVGLAQTRLALHDFAAAIEIANEVTVSLPDRLDAVAVAGDGYLAIGEYELAAEAFAVLALAAPDEPGVLVRQAEMARIEGRTDEATELAERAAGLIGEQPSQRLRRAWFEAFAAQVGFDAGMLERARSWAEAAVESDPESRAAAVTLARVLAADGDFPGAVKLYQAATGAVPDPGYLAELGDIYLLQGQTELAEDQFAIVETSARLAETEGVFDRALAFFYSDHQRRPERALAIAESDLDRRQDIGGWDVYAWALLQNGRPEEAREASDRARARGTVDARFLYHAGMISAALGETERAVTELEQALAHNPGFQPLQADRARATVAALR